MRYIGIGLGTLSALLAVVVFAVGLLAGDGGEAPSARARSAIPPAMLALYQQAATTCPGLPWAVVAAIGTIESDNGTSTAPGVGSGSNAAGAEGPMQILASTFASYAVAAPGGARPPDPWDPADAVYTAVHMLCANGGGDATTLGGAVYAYNHSGTYVSQVLALAASYESPAGSGSGGASGIALVAVDFAESRVGIPYLWGGTGDGGYDCSGLVQAAYAASGIALPRVAQEQFDAGPMVDPADPLQPGDLVFFGDSPSAVTHVGIVIGNGEMVDAPHTGTSVRVEGYDWPDYLGATRPSSLAGTEAIGGPPRSLAATA